MSLPCPQEPLGLPRGSVRAIIAIIIISGCVLAYVSKGDIPQGLSTLLGVVVTFYFKQREN